MKKFFAIGLFASIAWGLVLAQDDQQAQTGGAPDLAALRIVHLALDRGNVDIQIDGEVRISGLTGNSTSGYVFVTPGQHEVVALRAAGAQADDAAQAPAEPAAPADDAAADPAADPAVPADPAAAPETPAADAETDATLVSTTVNLEAGSYTTLLMLTGAAEGAGATAREEGDAAQDDVAGDAAAEDAAAGDAAEEVAGDADAAEGGDGAGGGAAEATTADGVDVVVIQDRIQSIPGSSQAMVRLVNVSRSGDLDLVGVLQAESDAANGADAPAGAEDARADGGADAEAEGGDGAAGSAEEDAAEAADQGDAAAEESAGDAEADAPAAEGEGADAPTVEGRAQPVQGEDLFTGLSNLSFGAAGDYQQVPAATYHIQVRGQDETVHLDLPETVLEPGMVYTFFASSTVDGNVLITISVDAGVNRADF